MALIRNVQQASNPCLHEYMDLLSQFHCRKQVEAIVVSRITGLRRLGRFCPAAGAVAAVHNKAHQQHHHQFRTSTSNERNERKEEVQEESRGKN